MHYTGRIHNMPPTCYFINLVVNIVIRIPSNISLMKLSRIHFSSYLPATNITNEKRHSSIFLYHKPHTAFHEKLFYSYIKTHTLAVVERRAPAYAISCLLDNASAQRARQIVAPGDIGIGILSALHYSRSMCTFSRRCVCELKWRRARELYGCISTGIFGRFICDKWRRLMRVRSSLIWVSV